MAQIREIKRRIKSINSTAKVTHAMELVSAAKMKKAQDMALSSRPYTLNLNEILKELRQKTTDSPHKLLQQNESEKSMIILLTTDRGLVGGLNMNLFRLLGNQTIGQLGTPTAQNPNSPKPQLVVVGKKGTNWGNRSRSDMVATFISDQNSPLELARTITKLAIDSFTSTEVGRVKILFPDFQSTIKQVPTLKQVLPIVFDQADTNHEPSIINHELLFEPSADFILSQVLPHYVLTQVYQAIMELKASEHSARMVAMKNATDAANDLVDDLTLTYNQARQEAITTELLDIVTAQSAFQ